MYKQATTSQEITDLIDLIRQQMILSVTRGLPIVYEALDPVTIKIPIYGEDAETPIDFIESTTSPASIKLIFP